MFPIPQSTSFVAVFKAYLSSDHVTEATGKTIAITISKAGGAFGNPNAGATNATEISSGWYKVTLDTTDTATLGILALRGTSAAVDDVGDRFFVVSASTGGITNLDAAITSRMATYTQPTGFLAATFPTTIASTTNITAGTITTVTNLTNAPTSGDLTATMKASVTTAATAATPTAAAVTGAVGSVTGAVGSVTGNVGGNVTGSVGSVTGLTASNLDAAISTRLASASYTAPDNATITAIAGYIDTEVAAIKAKTDNLPASPAATGDAMTLTGAYDAAKTAATQTSVDGIKAKTDSLGFTVSGKIDANIHYVNGVAVVGDGAGTPWGP